MRNRQKIRVLLGIASMEFSIKRIAVVIRILRIQVYIRLI